jgi:2-oxoglutarate ferredoxin oxidoreductase subunit alpha
MLRPKTLWPFPQKAFDKVNDRIKKYLDVEMSMGQMVPDVCVACNDKNKVVFHGRTGGNVPSVDEIVAFGKEVMGGDK